MTLKKTSFFVLFISLTFFYISCSTDTDETEPLTSGIESADKIDIRPSKIILGNVNMMDHIEAKSVEKIEIRPSKIILGDVNVNLKASFDADFDAEPVDSDGIQ